MNEHLKGKRVAITGAGRGLGAALALKAAEAGAQVGLLGRDFAALEKIAAEIRRTSRQPPLTVTLDLRRADSVAQACRQVCAAWKSVDVLINNGAPWLVGPLEKLSTDEISDTINAAVTGSILMVKHLLSALEASEGGADIVNMVSTCGLPNVPRDEAAIAYHAAKHGQSGMSDLMRQEMKPRGIRVMAVYPPSFDNLSPLDSKWDRQRDPLAGDNISTRDVVQAIFGALALPRTANARVIVLENMNPAAPHDG